MKIFLYFCAILTVVASTTCYSLTNFTARHELLGKKKANNQLECDGTCAEDDRCLAIVVNRKEDNVSCGFLGPPVPSFTCRVPVEVYKKEDCAKYEFVKAGCYCPYVPPGGARNNCAHVFMGSSHKQLNTSGLGAVSKPVKMETLVYKGCEMHFLLANKTTMVRKYDVPSSVKSDASLFVDSVDGVVDAWGYCAEGGAIG